MTLEQLDIGKLLPAWMREEADTAAMCRVLSATFRAASADIDRLSVWNSIDDMDAEELKSLAADVNAVWFSSGDTLEQMRDVLARSDYEYIHADTASYISAAVSRYVIGNEHNVFFQDVKIYDCYITHGKRYYIVIYDTLRYLPVGITDAQKLRIKTICRALGRAAAEPVIVDNYFDLARACDALSFGTDSTSYAHYGGCFVSPYMQETVSGDLDIAVAAIPEYGEIFGISYEIGTSWNGSVLTGVVASGSLTYNAASGYYEGTEAGIPARSYMMTATVTYSDGRTQAVAGPYYGFGSLFGQPFTVFLVEE